MRLAAQQDGFGQQLSLLEAPGGYSHPELLYQSERTVVLRARRLADDRAVIIKRPVVSRINLATTRAYEQEQRWRELLYPPTSDRGAEVRHQEVDGVPTLLQNDLRFEGLQRKMRQSGRLSSQEALCIAADLAEVLQRVHSEGFVHGDIHPGNVLVGEGGRAVLIDFERARRIDPSSPRSEDEDAGNMVGILAYAAPEATGQVSAPFDERSDLYSLGVTLFYMLTGQLPFRDDDPLSLLHAILAVEAPTASSQQEAIPTALSDLVAKMLAKDPSERYQTALGLQRDLEHCRGRLDATGTISHFPLARGEMPLHYRPSGSVYGREEETAALASALERAQRGCREVVLIDGAPGVGKSAVARTLRLGVDQRESFFIEGKFEQFRQLSPYSAWRSALSSLAHQIEQLSVRERDELLLALKERLGEGAGTLSTLVPSFEALLGGDRSPAGLSDEEVRNRINYAFENLFAALASAGKATVVMLDDIQWMDQASLSLLELLATSDNVRRVVFLCTFRTRELEEAPAVRRLIDGLVSRTATSISLDSLTRPTVGVLVAEAFQASPESVVGLADLVYAKTAGNPFFVGQFLMLLLERRLVGRDAESGKPTWEPEAIAAEAATGNVVELVLGRLQRMAPAARTQLSRAALLGARFSVERLATIWQLSDESVQADLEPAIAGRVLQRVGSELQFVHDRAQQAAYQLIAEDELPEVHVFIGARLAALNEQLHGETLLEVVDHLNAGQALIAPRTNREPVDELLASASIDRGWLMRHNRLAAEATAANGAHAAAFGYAEKALALMPESLWEDAPREALAIVLTAIRCRLNNVQLDSASELLDRALGRTDDPVGRVRLHQLGIRLLIARNDQHGALDRAVEALSLLGVELALDGARRQARVEELRDALRRPVDTISDLKDLPPLEGEASLLALEVMVGMAGAAYVMRPKLWELVSLELAHLTIDKGMSGFAPFAFGFYGVLLAGVYDEIDAGYRYGRLCLELTDQLEIPQLRAKAVNLFDVFIRHWKEPLRHSIETLPLGLDQGLQYGDFEYGSYNGIQCGKHMVLSGYQLDESVRFQNRVCELIRHLHMDYHLDFAFIWRQVALNLSGQAEDSEVLRSDEYDAQKLGQQLIEQDSPFLAFNVLASQTMFAVILGDDERALQAAARAEPLSFAVAGMAEQAQQVFFHAMALLQRADQVPRSERLARLRKVTRLQRRLRFWAEHAPANFAHKADLVAAEWCRVRKDPLRAFRYFEQAARGARKYAYLSDSALIAERYGEYLLSLGHKITAKALLSEAIDLYEDWGAHLKVQRLVSNYGGLLEKRRDVDASSRQANLPPEWLALVKSSIALSAERDETTLTQRLMATVSESSGANRSCLVLRDQGDWRVVADQGAGAEVEGRPLPQPLGAYGDPLIRVAVETVVARGTLLSVPDMASTDVSGVLPVGDVHQGSCLCIPLSHAGEMGGVLFLLNTMTKHAFPGGKVATLELLATQAMLAIERLLVLRSLEERVASRTADLSEAQVALQASEKRLKLAMMGAREGVFDWDLAGRFAHYSDSWKRMLGYEPDELPDEYETWQRLLHPETRAETEERLQEVLSSAAKSFSMEFKIRHRSGRYLDVRSDATVLREQTGRALRVVGTARDVTTDREYREKIERLALYDGLTNLPNRALFRDRLETCLAQLARDAVPFAVHMLDLDGFKDINDIHGHAAGDAVLEEVARRLQASVREKDTIARLGGDEFALIQTNLKQLDGHRTLSRRIIQSIEPSISLAEGALVRLGVSIGTCVVKDAELEQSTILRNADVALYEAKRRGKNCAVTYTEGRWSDASDPE